MPSYANQADFEAFVEGWTTTDVAALDRLLARAERDVDSAVGIWPAEANGLKFGAPKTTNQKALSAYQVNQLSRAVCAQAEYRVHMGEDFFVEHQVPTQGPDYSTTRALSYIGPKVMPELEATGLIRNTGRVGMPKGNRPPWFSFAYNVDDR